MAEHRLVQVPLPVGAAASEHEACGRRLGRQGVLPRQSHPGETGGADGGSEGKPARASPVLHRACPARSGPRGEHSGGGREVRGHQGALTDVAECCRDVCGDGDCLLWPARLEKPGVSPGAVPEQTHFRRRERALQPYKDIAPQRVSSAGALQRWVPHFGGRRDC